MSRIKPLSAFPPPALLGKIGFMQRENSWLNDFAGQYTLGRFANFWAMKITNLAPGTPAWLPSYHCGDEVQATLDAGFDVRFYHVGQDLEIDLDDLEKKVRRQPGPVLIIHYFGLPQVNIEHVARLCKSLSLPLIEDCAHALFSGHRGVALGEFGPLAVYSVRKTLGIYDGGLLLVDANKYHDWTGEKPGQAPPTTFSMDPYIVMLKSRVRDLVGSRITRLYYQARWKGQQNRPKVIVGFKPKESTTLSPSEIARAYGRRMSKVARWVARNADTERIVARRRHNWNRLNQQLSGRKGYHRVFTELPADCCPLVLPIWVQDNMRFMDHLQELGVNAYVFGAIPHPSLDQQEFPESSRLSSQIIGLPVQQELHDEQIDQIASIVAKCLPENTALNDRGAHD